MTGDEVEETRRRSVLAEGSRLTRYNTGNVIQIGDATFDFEYRRDTFEFHLPKEKNHYLGIPELSERTSVKTFLTNSGQAAINACYFYIDKVMGLRTIESHNDYLYVGAYRLQDLYKIRHTRDSSECLWICSTATRFETAMELEGNWPVVVVDTTCWELGSPELQKIYDKFHSRGLLIFFRSHSKLDMGGIEYGSLGNLTLFSDNKDLLDKTATQFRYMLGLNGGYASLDEIPPYLFTEEFYADSRVRVAKIMDNTRALKNEFQTTHKESGEFIFPDHLKYFFIRLSQETPEETCRKKLKQLEFMIRMYVPGAKSCASFGFNFPSITFYQADEGTGHFFRFCTGTVTPEENEKLALCIREVFTR